MRLLATNVMGVHHTHPKGEWMVGYQFMYMDMDGNRSGSSRVSTDDVLAQFPVAPTSMSMEMHMFEAMYGVTDKFTVMGMLPYYRKSMDHVMGMGGRFTTDSEGLGDLTLMGMYTFFERDKHQIHFMGGLSVPTGSIDKKDATPMGRVRLPYPMQLGSGTFDLKPDLTYLGHRNNWYWGANVGATLRLGRNDNDYSLGNEYRQSVWMTRLWNSWLSTSAQVKGNIWQDVDGADPQLNPAMVPTARPDLRGGERVDFLLGVNFFKSEGKLSGHRISIEAGVPIYQHLDGPQLETDWIFKAGWQWAF